MLEFLTLLSARFHAEVQAEALDIARAAMHDGITNVPRSIAEVYNTLAHATRTWGVVQSPRGYLLATPEGWQP